MNDSNIITSVLEGDRDSFAVLVVERFQRALYFVVGKVADDADAKDIVQKTFVLAFQKLAGAEVVVRAGQFAVIAPNIPMAAKPIAPPITSNEDLDNKSNPHHSYENT